MSECHHLSLEMPLHLSALFGYSEETPRTSFGFYSMTNITLSVISVCSKTSPYCAIENETFFPRRIHKLNEQL